MRSEMRPPITDVDGGPEQRNPERRDADVAKTQQQERVAGITEAEKEDERHRMPESAREAVAGAGG
jgi:hypothetical protein